MSTKRLNEARREFEQAIDEHLERERLKRRVYISGPMTDVPREQYIDAFRQAEAGLRAMGYHRIVNPIRVWACRWPLLYKIVGYKLTLLYDLWLLLRCKAIYLLPGWRESRGAQIEAFVARMFDIHSIN